MTTEIASQKGLPAYEAARIIAARSARPRKDWSRWLLVVAGLATAVAWLWWCFYNPQALQFFFQ